MATCLKCKTKYNVWKESYGDGLCNSCHQEAIEEAKRKKGQENRKLFQTTKTSIEGIISILTQDKPLDVTIVNWEVEKKMGSFFKKLPGLAAGIVLGGAGGEMLFGGTLLSKKEATYGGELGILIVTENKIIIGHATAPFQDEKADIGPEHIQLLLSLCNSNSISLKEFDIKHTQISVKNRVLERSDLLDSGSRLKLEDNKNLVVCNRSKLRMDPAPFEFAGFDSIYARLEKMGTLCTPAMFADSLTKNENPLADHHVQDIIENKGYLKEVIRFMYALRNTSPMANLASLAPPVKTALLARLQARADSSRIIRLMLFGSILLSFGFLSGIILSKDKDWHTFFIIASIAGCIAVIIFWLRKLHVEWCKKFIESKY
jgi:hypothetical protein